MSLKDLVSVFNFDTEVISLAGVDMLESPERIYRLKEVLRKSRKYTRAALRCRDIISNQIAKVTIEKDVAIWLAETRAESVQRFCDILSKHIEDMEKCVFTNEQSMRFGEISEKTQSVEREEVEIIRKSKRHRANEKVESKETDYNKFNSDNCNLSAESLVRASSWRALLSGPKLYSEAPASPKLSGEMPASGTPASAIPASGTPASEIPASGTPASAIPVSRTPVSGMPASGTPASGTPVSGTPVSGTPVSGTLASAIPVSRTPVSGTPASGTPASGTPASGTPASGTPASGTPVSGTPVSGTPVSGTPASGTLTGGTLAGGTPVSGTPASGTPASGTPASGTLASGTPTSPKIGGSKSSSAKARERRKHFLENCTFREISANCSSFSKTADSLEEEDSVVEISSDNPRKRKYTRRNL